MLGQVLTVVYVSNSNSEYSALMESLAMFCTLIVEVAARLIVPLVTDILKPLDRYSIYSEDILANHQAPEVGKAALYKHCNQWGWGAVDLGRYVFAASCGQQGPCHWIVRMRLLFIFFKKETGGCVLITGTLLSLATSVSRPGQAIRRIGTNPGGLPSACCLVNNAVYRQIATDAGNVSLITSSFR